MLFRSPKLVSAFLLVGLLPAAVIAILAMERSATSLKESSFNQLISVREIKRVAIEEFFQDRRDLTVSVVGMVEGVRKEAFDKLKAVQDLKKSEIVLYLNQVVANGVAALGKQGAIRVSLSRFASAFRMDEGKIGGETWLQAEPDGRKILEGAAQQVGATDVLLLDSRGFIVYSLQKGRELGLNVLEGPLKESGLAKAFAAVGTDGVVFADFEPYGPADGKPAAFVVASIVNDAGFKSGVRAAPRGVDQIKKKKKSAGGRGDNGA